MAQPGASVPVNRGPPARLLARLNANAPSSTSPAVAVDASSFQVSDAEIKSWLNSHYSWQCALCCERQPVVRPSFAMLEFAAAAVRRDKYSAACREARQQPLAPPPLPSLVPPAIDDGCLQLQTCRDCNCNGIRCAPGNAPGANREAVNYGLLLQLLSRTFGSADEAAAHLRVNGLDSASKIEAVLDAPGPDLPAQPTIASNSDQSLQSQLTRPPRPSFGIARNPVSVLGYCPDMLRHDYPLAFPIDHSARWQSAPAAGANTAAAGAATGSSDGHQNASENASAPGADKPVDSAATAADADYREAVDAAEAEAALQGPCFVPRPAPYPELHVERPDRLRAATSYLAATGLWQCFHRVPAVPATETEVALACTPQHLAELRALVSSAPHHQRCSAVKVGDTYFNRHTLDAAKLALGTTIAVTEAVVSGQAGRGMALVRPPGHHADCAHSQGFCIFNSAAAAAKIALQRHPDTVKRVLILDWDIHHGDGTEAMTYDRSDILYVSVHRHDGGAFYPGTGHAGRVGEGDGRGFNVNIPLTGLWYGDADYLTIFDQVVMPIARSYSPDLVIISCGFDAARGDFLGDFDVTPAGYAHMTHMLSSLAGGKVVVVMEGGYNLHAIAQSTEAISRVLLGEPPMPLEAFDAVRNKVRDEQLEDERLEYNASAAGASLDGCSLEYSNVADIDSAPMGHGIPRRVPRAGTWKAINDVILAHAPFWPVLNRQRTAADALAKR